MFTMQTQRVYENQLCSKNNRQPTFKLRHARPDILEQIHTFIYEFTEFVFYVKFVVRRVTRVRTQSHQDGDTSSYNGKTEIEVKF